MLFAKEFPSVYFVDLTVPLLRRSDQLLLVRLVVPSSRRSRKLVAE